MKINNIQSVNKIIKSYNKNLKIENKKFKQEEDKIEISTKAHDYQVAFNGYKQLPSMREARVEDVKNKINLGTYQVSMGQVADKILKINNSQE